MLSPSLVLLSNQSALDQAVNIIANNVANSGTDGFKRQGIEFDTLVSQPKPGEKINFVSATGTYRDTSTGPITPTGNTFDVAIEGAGYFEVQAQDGSKEYTRVGAFRLDTQGQIVTQAGQTVLSDGGSAIIVPDTTRDITITGDGTVSARVDNGVDLAVLGKLGIATFADDQQMQPMGQGLYTTAQTPLPTVDSAILVQGSLEESNVKPVTEMTDLIKVQRAYEQTANLISMENQRLDNAITMLSKTTE